MSISQWKVREKSGNFSASDKWQSWFMQWVILTVLWTTEPGPLPCSRVEEAVSYHHHIAWFRRLSKLLVPVIINFCETFWDNGVSLSVLCWSQASATLSVVYYQHKVDYLREEKKCPLSGHCSYSILWGGGTPIWNRRRCSPSRLGV